MTDAQVEAVVEAIEEIPARGGGAMELYPETLRQKLSPELIRTIARAALAAAQDWAQAEAEQTFPYHPPPEEITEQYLRGELRVAADRLEIAAGVCKQWSERIRALRPPAPAGAPSKVLLTGVHPSYRK